LWVAYSKCLLKAGARKEARSAANQAAKFGSAGVRLDAYDVLGKAGVDLGKGKPIAPGDCLSIPSSSDACLQPTWACGYATSDNGMVGPSRGSGTVLCPSRERATGGDWEAKRRVLDAPVPACAVIDLGTGSAYRCRPASAYQHDLCEDCKCAEAADATECEKAVSQCTQDPRNRRYRRCTLVYADACMMRVGAICDGKPVEYPP
jgi:hypothetical protein